MIASRLKFKLDDMVTTMDNGLLFGGLNSYAGQKRGFEYPPAGFLIKAQIKDIFEDYVMEGGVRIPTNFNGTDVAAASWTQVTIPTYMTGLDWNFVNSGAISLAGFNNQPSVFVAFKYTSSATLSGTWEIKNVKITK